MNKPTTRNPWAWIPSLYFAEGVPYIIVMFVSKDMFKTLGVSNTSLTFWTSALYLAWVIKPLWSPYIDIYFTKRKWIIWMQLALVLSFFGISMALQTPMWFTLSLIFLWVMAFESATHDVAADGFYMLGLDEHNQAFFTGIRSTFYRLAMIAGLGLLGLMTGLIIDNTGLETVEINVKTTNEVQTEPFNVNNIPNKVKNEEVSVLHYPKKVEVPFNDSTIIYFVLSAPPAEDEEIKMSFGHKKGSADIYLTNDCNYIFTSENWNKPVTAVLKVRSNLKEPAEARFDAKAGNVPLSWTISFSVLALMFLFFAIYHRFVLPYPERSNRKVEKLPVSYWHVFKTFFQKEGIIPAIAFLLFYRFAESQVTALASPFLLDSMENGGLALSLTEKSIAYGTVGLAALIVGGILGGILASKHGLKKWVWWMALSINLPNIVYVYLSYVLPDSFIIVNIAIAIEQFGYGFGFTAYMLYMLYIAGRGEYKTAHFAIATGFMALGMMLPGMVSGAIQEALGYQHFFVYVMLCTIPSFIALSFLKIDSKFGTKEKK